MYHGHRADTGRDKEPNMRANHLLSRLHTHSYIDNQNEGTVRAAIKLTNRLAELVEKDNVFLLPSLYFIQSASCNSPRVHDGLLG